MRRWLGFGSLVTSLGLLPALLSPSGALAAGMEAPDLPPWKVDQVVPFVPQRDAVVDQLVEQAEADDAAAGSRAGQDQARMVRWPRTGNATLTMPKTGVAKASPGALPITLAATDGEPAASSVSLHVQDQNTARAAGVKGVLLIAQAATEQGRARMSIDYGAFASAYGGDWSGRLGVVRLPGCVLTTPEKAACRTQQRLDSVNDRRTQTLRTTLDLTRTPTVLAVVAAEKSGGGDYKATPLSASSTWEAGGSSGTFTWSYPIKTPPAAAGPAPDLSLRYDSGTVDGRTANTNNQTSWLGEGFDTTATSYIERKYGSCDDDGQQDKYDLCWKFDNASLVLNGRASELVKDDTTGEWRLQNDDASKVTRATGAENGDDNGEHWIVTTGDGAEYHFGLNKLDGAGTDDRTESVWTVPVFGDDEGEPGYDSGSTFAERAKNQAWRWNLDYIVDTHGNAMTYWYRAEHNNYAKNGKDDPGTDYVRGGYLREIRYGQRAGALFSATPQASHKVVFSVAERCLASGTGCDALDEAHRDNWPDVPYDSICNDDETCTGLLGPSFFSRKRLTAITTYAWDAAAATPDYSPAESWTLKHLYLDPGETGDSSDQSLWLDEIQHTGKHGTGITLDPVRFGHEMLTNRVDGASDDILPLAKPRLRSIVSETGSQTVIDYQSADCVAGSTMPASPDSNTMRCYPVYWSPNGASTPQLDWFQKYPVTGVRTADPYGGAETVVHTYTYSGGGAWHYNDDPMTPADERTWSAWRGFGRVTHLVGNPDGPQSKTVTVYLRGMHGDRQDDGTTRTASVTGIKAPAINDLDQYAGLVRETVTYNGTEEVSGTINDPWSQRTATQHKSYADIEAYYVRTKTVHQRTRITSGTTPTDRVRTTTTTYDDYGMPATVEDSANPGSGDETCTRTWYARNDELGLTSLVSRTQTVSRTCAVATADLDLPADSSRPGDVVVDTATTYDATTPWSPDQVPTKGEPRWTGRAMSYGSDNQPTWQKTGTAGYDTLGRITSATDTAGNTTTTAYTPTAAGPLTSSTVTNPKGHAVTTTADPVWGAPIKINDPNSRVTEMTYDSLGRLTQVWLPNRVRAAKQTPNKVHAYHLSSTGPSWVSTSTFQANTANYNTSYEIYDSLLRVRQVQAPEPNGGRVIDETLYDDRGLAITTNTDIYDNSAAPAGTLVATDGGQAPSQTDTTYDAAGRPTRSVVKNYNITRWETTTTYTGDTVATTAPEGGSATAVVTDALGQITERREYPTTTPTGTNFARTTFTYTPDGQNKTIVGPDEATWSYGYDLFGRPTSATDPDKGTTTTTYDALDQVERTDAANDTTLLYSYDELGRKTGLWQDDRTDTNKLASWSYDTRAKGQLDAWTRYDQADGDAAYTKTITAYDKLYRATSTKLTLPANSPLVAAGVPQNLTSSAVYQPDGSLETIDEPAVGALTAEHIDFKYDSLGNTTEVQGNGSSYLLNAAYSPMGDLRQLTLGSSSASTAPKTYVTHDYEAGTRRLARSRAFLTADTTKLAVVQDLNYTQDDAGNVTSIFDTATANGAVTPDYQCFTYDGHRRLTESWTPKTADCATTGRTTANLGGPAPYWTSYTYNDAGQRTTQTQHTTAGDTTTTHTYATDQPHSLAKTETLAPGDTTPTTHTYAYDDAGNTTSRPGTQTQQTLAWDSEGKLAQATEPAIGDKPALDTAYLYDPDGNLLVRRSTTADGEIVLYLGSTEVRLKSKGATTTLGASRYYTAADQTLAVRTGTKGTTDTTLTFLAGDNHGTTSLAVDATTSTFTKRQMTPFGAPRGPAPAAWPDDKAFLGKPADTTTGLTHIGAREYDPAIGSFISVDPILETDKAQTLNGYTYASNNPATFSDPTGLRPVGACGGPCPMLDGFKESWSGGPGHWDYTYGEYSGALPGGTNYFVGDTVHWRSNADSARPHEETFFIPQPKKQPGKKWRILGAAVQTMVSAHPLGAVLFTAMEGSRCKNGEREACLNVGASLATGGKAMAARPWANSYSSCKCFLAGTEVLMADGSTKDIEDIEVGDKVTARDPETGEEGARTVTHLIVTDDDKQFNKLSIATDDGIEQLTATHEHPFWSPSEDRWVKAADFRPGMTLLTDDESTVIITANRPFAKQARTYNLTVDDLHTYYVLAGATPVLVHNTGPFCGSGPVAGVLEVSDRFKSVGAIKSFNPAGERDFVFDPATGRFATGADQGIKGHDGLRMAIGADESTVVGGRLSRGPNGEFLTNEWSGHYGHQWTPAIREQFSQFMQGYGLNVVHTPWGG